MELPGPPARPTKLNPFSTQWIELQERDWRQKGEQYRSNIPVVSSRDDTIPAHQLMVSGSPKQTAVKLSSWSS